MSDPVLITIIGSVQAVALAVIAAWLKTAQDQRDRNHADTKRSIVATQGSIEVVRQDINGKMDNLLQTTAEAERAKGVLEGRAAESADREVKASIIAEQVVPTLVEQLPDKIADKIIPQLRPTARKKEPGQ